VKKTISIPEGQEQVIGVEALDPAVQADVRLGLLMPRAAVVLGQLPRGNQHAAAGVVIRHGLTVRQVELWVAELLACADERPCPHRDEP